MILFVHDYFVHDYFVHDYFVHVYFVHVYFCPPRTFVPHYRAGELHPSTVVPPCGAGQLTLIID